MIDIGKIKQGTKFRTFNWGHNDYSKNDIPSTTTVIISKNHIKRNEIIKNVKTTDDFTVVQLEHNDKLVNELQKYKKIVKDRISNPDNIINNFLLCLDDYDLLLYEDTITSVNLIKNCINYINDYGKRVGVYLLLGCNSLSEKFIETVDNVILLPPYHLTYLNYMFKNSIYEIINNMDTLGQFCKANGITIDQLYKEPTILKNINNIYVYMPNKK